MVRYLVQRLLTMIPIAILVTMMVFFLLYLSPGDPLSLLVPAADIVDMDEAALQALRHQHGLDRPLPVQYASWLARVIRGDLGRSLRTKQKVSEMLAYRIPVTLELGLLSIALSLVVAIPAGIYSALRPNSLGDVVGSTAALFGLCSPSFWIAVILILVFGVKLHWLPPTGFVRWTEGLVPNLRSLILPSITMGTAAMASAMRMTRSSMLDVLGQDYLRTARAKGLRERTVVLRHALKNALIPVVTTVGLQLATVLGGALIVEYMFSIPGMGKMTIDAIFSRDFPVVQGSVLVTTLALLIVNLLVDLVYAFLDPRIRYA